MAGLRGCQRARPRHDRRPPGVIRPQPVVGRRDRRRAVGPVDVQGDVVVAGPGDTLDTAFKRMKGADVSQLPIIEDGRLVGILDESDLIRIMNTDEITRKERFAKPVASAMTRDLDTLQVNEPLDALIPVFDRDRVAIVLDGERFVGLITRTDLINHLSLNR